MTSAESFKKLIEECQVITTPVLRLALQGKVIYAFLFCIKSRNFRGSHETNTVCLWNEINTLLFVSISEWRKPANRQSHRWTSIEGVAFFVGFFLQKKEENEKYVYLFSEGDASMRNLLGGKGANLAENDQTGSSGPAGFLPSQPKPARDITMTTGRSTRISRHRSMPQSLKWRRSQAKKFGDKQNPRLSPYGPAPEPPCPV